MRIILIAIVTNVLLFSCREAKQKKPTETLKWQASFSEFIKKKQHYTNAIDSVITLLQDSTIDNGLRLEAAADLATRFNCNSSKPFEEELLYQSKKLNSKNGKNLSLLLRQRCLSEVGAVDSSLYYFNFLQEEFSKDSTRKIEILALINLADAFIEKTLFEKGDSILRATIPIAEVKGNIYLLAKLYFDLAECNRLDFKNDSAIKYQKISLHYAIKCNEAYFVSVGYINISEALLVEANYNNALEYLDSALTSAYKGGERFQEAHILGSIGEIYRLKEDYSKALQNLFKAIKASEKTNYKYQEAYSITTVGEVYRSLKKYDLALQFFNKAIKMDSLNGWFDEEMYVNTCLGSLYYELGEIEKAETYFAIVINNKEKLYDKTVICNAYYYLGLVKLKQNKIEEAESNVEKGYSVASEANITTSKKDFSELFHKIYEQKGECSRSLTWFKAFIALKDSANNLDQIKRFANAEYNIKISQFNITQAKKDANAALEQQRKESELNRQRILSYTISIGFIIMLLFAILIYRSLQDNKKKTKIISEQKKEVELQKEIIEEKKKEVLDSIAYAKKIQEAILPSIDNVKKVFPESFVLYKPKDIVAGDFYWLEKSGDTILIAAGDCTGHGVPGAMVSVVCSNALNRAVKEFGLSDPGLILNKVREIVIDTFEKSGSEVKDGMDISLLALNEDRTTNNIEIKWAGANNPLWYISNGKMEEIKADKQPVGKFINNKPFTTQCLNLKKGDIAYLITDGFADQFGGPKGKKFKYKNLKELLLQNASMEMAHQHKVLNENFSAWKANLEQIDDVTIIGIKL